MPALASGGTTFSADDDPELIRPAASGFTQYGYTFPQQDADNLATTDVAPA